MPSPDIVREPPSFVKLEDVSVQFGLHNGTLALEQCSLSVKQGEFIAVVGPSGCGKSTLMRLVTGLWPATDGNVIVAGREVDGPHAEAGMAFQNPTLLPWRTVLGNVMLPLEIVRPHRDMLSKKRAAYEAKARHLLALVGLAGFEEKYPRQLSGGMQQRASLCRALIHEPRLLMLDEPFAALDVFTREELWVALQDLCSKLGQTVILVTHDLREAVFLAEKIVVLSSRPAHVVEEHLVGLPRPRTLDDLFSPRAQELIVNIRKQISTK